MSEIKPLLKLRATLSIDIDAKDYIHAATIQGEMERLCEELRDKYVGCTYDIRERRDRGEPAPVAKPTRQKRTRSKSKTSKDSPPNEPEPAQEAVHAEG